MSADRYEISECELDVLAITGPEGTRYIDGEDIEAKIIRQQARDIAALKDALADEVTANEAFRKAGGARDDEDMPTFCARLVAERDEAVAHWNMSAKCVSNAIDEMSAACVERDQLRTDLAAAVAERDRLIAELPLSTGRDVNETRERLGPITRIADGPSERAYVCATTARDVVGYVIAERDSAKLRAEQAEARLAAIEAAPVVASVGHGDYLHRHTANVPVGTLLIARPAKD